VRIFPNQSLSDINLGLLVLKPGADPGEAAIRRFVGRHFVPGNMAVSLVGGVSPARVRRGLNDCN
jgi:hypothetical protein